MTMTEEKKGKEIKDIFKRMIIIIDNGISGRQEVRVKQINSHNGRKFLVVMVLEQFC